MKLITALLLCGAIATGLPSYAQTPAASPRPDIAGAALYQVDSLYQMDLSSWYTGEKQTFSALFEGSHFDWLLTPAQIQAQGFDHAERLMMSAELARAFNIQGISVPDPYLVGRALDTGERLIRFSDIDALSRVMGATTIVLPYVGHDEAGNLKVTLAVYLKSSKIASIDSVRPLYFTAQTRRFDDTAGPIDAFRAALPELMKALALSVPLQTPVDQSSAPMRPLRLPDSPEQLSMPADDGALADAARFAVLAYLAPPDSQIVDRLFGRSLLASLRAPDSPQQEFLHAYALLRVRLRPAALAVLKGKSAPALMALAAIANGNLTGLDGLISKTSDYERLILEGEAHDLWRYYYRTDDEQPLGVFTAAVAARSGLWRMLLERRWEYGRPGSERSNVPLKRVLDQLYPVSGQSLQGIIEGQRATLSQPVGGLNLELSVHQHISHLLREQASSWCCKASAERPSAWDFLTLIEAWSDENLLQAVQTEQFFQGLPETADAMLTPLDAYYGGRTDFELLHAQIDLSLAQRSTDPQQTSLRRSALEHALRALIAAGGQTDDSIEAVEALRDDPTALPLAEAYGKDYPLHDTWITNSLGVEPAEQLLLLRRALANTERWVGAAEMLLTVGGDKEKSEVKASIEGRFLGNPDREQIEEKLLNKPLTPTSAIAMLQKKVQAQPDVWDLRDELGHTLALQRDYAQAAKVMSEYPGFAQQNPADGVYLAGIAADTAFMFYWYGAESEARQFLNIATRFDVGSESAMAAAVFLSVLNDDLPRALAQTEQWVDRYPDDYSYSNYIPLLHLLGRSEQAWEVFNTLLSRPMGAGEWSGADVGLRIAGTTPAQLYAWISRPEIAQAQTAAVSWPARFLLMWATTDRAMPADLPQRVASLGKEPRGVTEDSGGRIASYPAGDGGQRYLVSRSNFGADRRLQLTPGTSVDSDSLLFAQALVPFQAGDFSAAVMKFDELAARYPIEVAVQGANAMYALPYFAYASAKSGDRLKLQAYVSGLKEANFYEFCLAKAYFDALTDHDVASALKQLDQGFLWMSHDSDRAPSGEYQYADTAERLYRETGDKRFRDRALSWARTMQHLEPWIAWSYTIDVELTDDPQERRSALVKALFLDPLSPRLKAISAADLEYAKAQLSDGNPFLRLHPDTHSESTQATPAAHFDYSSTVRSIIGRATLRSSG